VVWEDGEGNLASYPIMGKEAHRYEITGKISSTARLTRYEQKLMFYLHLRPSAERSLNLSMSFSSCAAVSASALDAS
jgi:hypothetical protein